MKLQNTLIITFITLISISFKSFSEDFSSKNAACNAALNKGDISSADNLAEEVLKRDTNNREALICKGRLLGAQGKFDEALNALKHAEALSKEQFDHVIGNMLIGNVYKAQQKYTDAITSYEASLAAAKAEKNEKYIRADDNLIGDIQSRQQDYNAALASYQAGSKLAMNDNERAESFVLLAATYKSLGQFDKAIEYQIKAVQMQKIAGTLDEYADANLSLGQYYLAAKDYVGADKTLSKLAKFAKENGGAYYEAKANLFLAQSKIASGDNAAAKTLLADARVLAKSVGASDLALEIDTAEKNLK